MISVIVPAYNAADTIGDCLNALLDQTVPQSEYEIIVVDDGSSDNTREIIEGYDVKVLSQPNGGPGAARNLGVRHARGDIVLFTDADCVPTPDWIAELIRPLCDDSVVGVKGAYRTRQRSLLARFIQLEFEERYELLNREHYIDFVDSHSAAYRKKDFLAAGGFDTGFRISEDVDLAYRLSSEGHKMVFNPRAVVYHRHPDTCVRYLKLKFQRAYWRSRTYRRHPQKMLHDSYTPQNLKLQIGLACLLVAVSLYSSLAYVLGWRSQRSRLVSWVVPGVAGLFLVSTVPFVKRTLATDRAVGLLSPVFLFLRAIGLGFGFVAGIITGLSGELRG